MNRKTSTRIGNGISYLLLSFLSILFLVPFAWMISSSLKPNYAIFIMPPQWIPKPAEWSNYVVSLTKVPFAHYFTNTLFIIVLNIIGTLITSTMAGYAFARLRAPFKGFLFSVMIGSMMLPSAVTRIPSYVIWNFIGLIDTPWPLIIPAFFGGAFNIFLIKQFFSSIPYEIEESAHIDGARVGRIIWSIMVPLILPVLAAITIFTFMGCWNDFEGPLIYLNSQNNYTIALGLNAFKSRYGVQWNHLMAASVVVALPGILIYAFLQRYFTEGILLGGIKG